MTKLSVNVNKIATLRNARGGNVPNLLKVALDCEKFGAQGITVHPRPDQRHIRYQDVYDLSRAIQTEFNVEGYPSEPFMELVLAVKPTQVTLVPDPPGVLTSDAGWDAINEKEFLCRIVDRLKSNGIRTSMFMETDLNQIAAAASTKTDRIELYTGPYAENFSKNPKLAVDNYRVAAEEASRYGLGINAGHDLNLDNLSFFKQSLPQLQEVSIGHALISDALYYGLEETIKRYLNALKGNTNEIEL